MGDASNFFGGPPVANENDPAPSLKYLRIISRLIAAIEHPGHDTEGTAEAIFAANQALVAFGLQRCRMCGGPPDDGCTWVEKELCSHCEGAAPSHTTRGEP
jgi:hypothetical protein